jgi:hypothetical protein
VQEREQPHVARGDLARPRRRWPPALLDAQRAEADAGRGDALGERIGTHRP